jgi:hypothetical protein
VTHDPRRLSDDPAEPELARALRDAQGDVLSPEAVARVRAALVMTGVAAASGAGAAGLGAGLRSPLAKLLAAAARLGVGLACLGLAVGAGVVVMRRASTHEGGASVPPTPSAATTTAPAEGSASPTLDAPPEAAPTATAVETSRARAGARATGEPQRPSAADANPSPREGALLLEARRALGTDPARALALVREHEQEFPRSQLERERRRIAAEARQRLEKGGLP